jgi:hypothetical protein
MRIDPNFIVFAGHTDWYVFEKGVGYTPTDKAPEEAVKAMKAFNSYTYKTEHSSK